METTATKPGLVNYMIRYGLMIAAIQIVVFLILYLLDFNPFMPGKSMINLFITLLVNIVILRIAMIKYREVNFEGRISFGQLFIVGALILVVSGAVASLFSYAFYAYYEPDLMMRYAQDVLDRFEGQLPEAQFEKMEQRMMDGVENTKALWGMLINIAVSSVVLSAIVALFIKKDTTLIPE